MHLFNRRAGHGSDDADLGFDPTPLEGDPREPAQDEGPALVPFGADFPPAWSTRSGEDEGGSLEARVLARVRDLELLGRSLDGLPVLRQALSEAPVAVPLWLRLAELLEGSGEEDAALDELDQGLRLTKGDPALRVHRGALLGRMGRHAESEEALRSALEVAPESVEGQLHLGLSLLRRGRHTDALGPLERAMALAPDRGDVAFYLGEGWYHAGQLDQALLALERATELTPNDPRAYKLLGRLLDRMGRTEEAMAMHRKARGAGS